MVTSNKDKSKAPQPLSIPKNTFWNSMGSIYYQGCQWLITVLVVKLSSGYANAGYLAYAMTIGNLFTPIALYGMRVYQVSDVKNRYSQSNYFAFRLVTIAIGFLVSMAYVLIVSATEAVVSLTFFYLLFKVDEVFANVPYAVEQKAYRMDYIGVSQLLRGTICLVVFSTSLFFTNDINLAVLFMFLGCILVTIFYDLSHAKYFGDILPHISSQQTVALLKQCFPIVISNVACGLTVSVVRQYFGNVYGEEALGIYASVATPSVLIQLLAQYLYSPILAPLSKLWAEGNKEKFIHFFRKFTIIMICVCVFAIIILTFAGKPLLVFFYGQEMLNYVYLFPMVLVSTSLVAFLWFCMDVFVVFRDFFGSLISNIISLTISVVSMVPLIANCYMNGINFSIILGLGSGIAYAILRMSKSIKRHFDK